MNSEQATSSMVMSKMEGTCHMDNATAMGAVPSQCACFTEHMVCWTSVKRPHRPDCVRLDCFSSTDSQLLCCAYVCTFVWYSVA